MTRIKLEFVQAFIDRHGACATTSAGAASSACPCLSEANGRRVMLLKREHLQRIVNEKAATPSRQRNFLNRLQGMFDWAVGEGGYRRIRR